MRAKVEGLALFRRFGICTSGGRRCALSNHGHSFLLVPTPTLPCLCASQPLLLPSRPPPKPARTETARLFAAVKYPALASQPDWFAASPNSCRALILLGKTSTNSGSVVSSLSRCPSALSSPPCPSPVTSGHDKSIFTPASLLALVRCSRAVLGFIPSIPSNYIPNCVFSQQVVDGGRLH